MMRFGTGATWVLGLVLLAATSPALGQVIITTPVYRATTNDAVAERVPGNMIGAGLSQYAAARDQMDMHPEITGEAGAPSIKAQMFAEMARIVFQQLEYAITAIHNVILVRGGRTPNVLPDTIPSPNTELSNHLNQTGANDDLLNGLDLSDLANLLGTGGS